MTHLMLVYSHERSLAIQSNIQSVLISQRSLILNSWLDLQQKYANKPKDKKAKKTKQIKNNNRERKGNPKTYLQYKA